MADTTNDADAQKAYADASSAVKPTDAKPLAESLKADAAANKVEASKPAPAKTKADEALDKKTSVTKASDKKTAPKKTSAKRSAAKKAAPKTDAKKSKKNAAPKKQTGKSKKKAVAAKPQSNVTKLKETIMANKTTDYTSVMTDTMSNSVNELQTRAQAAYEKSTAVAADMTDFAKGNVEAIVESGKLMAEGMQAMGKTYADEAKSAYETATADLKEMAAVKSPTELFQLQGKILRRNFDAMVAASSKNTDAAVKLANEAMTPLSGRVNVAVEKLSKVA